MMFLSNDFGSHQCNNAKMPEDFMLFEHLRHREVHTNGNVILSPGDDQGSSCEYHLSYEFCSFRRGS